MEKKKDLPQIKRKLRPDISIFQKSIFSITPVKRICATDSNFYYVIDKQFSKTMWNLFLYLRWHEVYKLCGIKNEDFFLALNSLDDENIVMTFRENGEFVDFPPKIYDLEVAVYSKSVLGVLNSNSFLWDFIFILLIIGMFSFFILPASIKQHFSGLERYFSNIF